MPKLQLQRRTLCIVIRDFFGVWRIGAGSFFADDFETSPDCHEFPDFKQD
jgi:hypothetical protein